MVWFLIRRIELRSKSLQCLVHTRIVLADADANGGELFGRFGSSMYLAKGRVKGLGRERIGFFDEGQRSRWKRRRAIEYYDSRFVAGSLSTRGTGETGPRPGLLPGRSTRLQ